MVRSGQELFESHESRCIKGEWSNLRSRFGCEGQDGQGRHLIHWEQDGFYVIFWTRVQRFYLQVCLITVHGLIGSWSMI